MTITISDDPSTWVIGPHLFPDPLAWLEDQHAKESKMIELGLSDSDVDDILTAITSVDNIKGANAAGKDVRTTTLDAVWLMLKAGLTVEQTALALNMSVESMCASCSFIDPERLLLVEKLCREGVDPFEVSQRADITSGQVRQWRERFGLQPITHRATEAMRQRAKKVIDAGGSLDEAAKVVEREFGQRYNRSTIFHWKQKWEQ